MPRSIAEIIDELLAAEKTLVGVPTWTAGNRDEQLRLVWPLLVDGESRKLELLITAKLNSDDPWFSILFLVAGECVWRLDYDLPHRMHVNDIQKGNPLSGLVMFGPHYHAWDDNRHLATQATLPKRLAWRRELESNFHSWESRLRWFFGKVNIAQPPTIPEYPRRTRLSL